LLQETEAVAPVRTMTRKERGALLLSLAEYSADIRLARQAARLGAVRPVRSHVSVAARSAARWARRRPAMRRTG